MVDSEVKLPLALYLASRKDAPDDVKKVIEAAASVAGSERRRLRSDAQDEQ